MSNNVYDYCNIDEILLYVNLYYCFTYVVYNMVL